MQASYTELRGAVIFYWSFEGYKDIFMSI